MRIAWFSNAPWAGTGYGTQTKQVTERLIRDGHEVAVIANWGLTGAPQNNDGLTVFPQGTHPYSLDSADFYAGVFEADLVVSLYDVWPLAENERLFAKHRAVYWTPVDHDPAPPKVLEWARSHDTIAMSRWGQERLAAAGIEAGYIPHAIDTAVFSPGERTSRKMLGVPPDAHVTMINSANIGQAPPRKRWFENLLAWRAFAERHEDAFLYLHTALRHPRGIDLADCIRTWGLPEERVVVVDQGAYLGGFIGQSDVADLYRAADVLLMATAGEGFGIPAIEAQACGIPVIVTDFSAQPELVGAGWKVPWVPDWDYMQMSIHAKPDPSAIADALEASYIASKDRAAQDAMTAAAVAKAAEYDADMVYDAYWRPFLEAEAKPERKGMTNAAKRRRQKLKAVK